MSNFKFKLNRDGVREVLKSEGVQGVLSQKGAEVQNRCGDGYDQSDKVGKKRAYVTIYASSFKAKRENKKNNTLLKALR